MHTYRCPYLHNITSLEYTWDPVKSVLISKVVITAYAKCKILSEPVHEISNNVVCATSKASYQPAHMRSLIRAFASRLSIL